MSDEAALLAAIAAHPEEDTPRLVYADWLDEHGQPIRAEFIRVQIAIAQKEHLPRAILNRYVDLFKRNQELLDNYRAELLGPLASLPTDGKIEFRRGFAWEVTLTCIEALDSEQALVNSVPIPRIVLADDVAFVRWTVLLDAGENESRYFAPFVTAIRIISDHDDDRMNRQFEIQMRFRRNTYKTPWPRLEALDVSSCGIDTDILGPLFRPAIFPQLVELDLSNNILDDHSVDFLLGSGLPPQLKRLVLGGNDITDDGAMALAARWPTGDADQLEYLIMRFTNIGPVGQRALLDRFGGRVDLF